MMKLLIGLSVLCVCVFAGHYVFPKSPCEWELRVDFRKPESPGSRYDREWTQIQRVNGEQLMFDCKGFNTAFVDRRVYRSDLEDDTLVLFREFQQFSTYDYTLSVKNQTHERVEQLGLYRPCYPPSSIIARAEEISFWYDQETTGTYHGKPCKVCTNTSSKEVYYIGLDGYPIGMSKSEELLTANFTFKRKAPLSLFVFSKYTGFKDQRCYTAPNVSTCPEEPSSEDLSSSSSKDSPTQGSSSPSSEHSPTQDSSLSGSATSSARERSNNTLSYLSSCSSLSLSFLAICVVSMITLLNH